MDKIRGVVVAVLLSVWCFPAVSSAKSLATDQRPLPAAVTERSAAPAEAPATGEATSLAAREQQAPNLQDYKGGAVAVYVSSGVLLVAVIVLLVLLV